MARIDVKWSEPTLNTYDHINTADFFTALPADFKADGKPLLIYVTSTNDVDKIETQNIECSVLRDESVTIGATMFRSIKVKGSSINKGHPFYATLGGKELPAMIVVDANGQKVGAEEADLGLKVWADEAPRRGPTRSTRHDRRGDEGDPDGHRRVRRHGVRREARG
jgi:hypothetical protein